jgi:hypothetical protein
VEIATFKEDGREEHFSRIPVRFYAERARTDVTIF